MQEVTRCDNLDALLSGWYDQVSETHVIILRAFCVNFDKKPPPVKKGKKQTSIFHAWKTGLVNIIDAAQGHDLVQILIALGEKYTREEKREFYKTPHSLIQSVHDVVTETSGVLDAPAGNVIRIG